MSTELRDELRRLAKLLERYGYMERARFLVTLADDRDDEQLLTVASGLEVWGGSGAVWEVEPFNYSHPSVSASEDYVEFQRGMIRVAELLEAQGRGHLARRNADFFRQSLDRAETT